MPRKSISAEISKIDYLLEKYSYLLKGFSEQEPEERDLLALSNLLHTFYTGVEKLFFLISKEVDKEIVSGDNSHKILLNKMAKNNSYRENILTNELYVKLADYLAYRHLYRHAYSFELKWSKMRHLVIDIYDVWVELKNCIYKVLELNFN